MAKKVKRNIPQSNEAVSLNVVRESRTSSNVFNPDYTYIIQDLKRIAIMAGSFIVILVVLSFILN